MIWLFAALSLLTFAAFLFKATVVWSASHDIYNGGGVPTMDFPVFYPVFIAFFLSNALRFAELYPFPYFGACAWFGVMLSASLFMWYADRHGEPERQRQLDAIQADTEDGG